jgi:hypothetical protein
MNGTGCPVLGCMFGECQADGSCACYTAFKQTVEFDSYNPSSPPNSSFAPCDVLGVVPEVLWGMAGVLSVSNIALYFLLWRRHGGKLVHRLPFVAMNGLCAVAGFNRALVPEAVFFQSPLVTWAVLNWFGLCICVLGLFLDKQLNAMVRLLDNASLQRVSNVRRQMKWFRPFTLVFINFYTVVTFIFVPPEDRTTTARWILFAQIPFTGYLFGAAWYASYLLEKQYEGLRAFNSQVQRVKREGHATHDDEQDVISVRVRKQLFVLRSIRRNQQYFFLANSSYCLLVFCSAVSRLRNWKEEGGDSCGGGRGGGGGEGGGGERPGPRPRARLTGHRRSSVARCSKSSASLSTSCRE